MIVAHIVPGPTTIRSILLSAGLVNPVWNIPLRIPAVHLTFPNPFSGEQKKEEQTLDPRLEQLRQDIESSGEIPFIIDNGTIVKAVPKKKVSYRNTRTKLYAPGEKQIKHLNNLVRCPACGHTKRSHFLCMHCFAEIRSFLKSKKREGQHAEIDPQSELDPIDERILYPGKRLSEYERRLKSKDWIPVREKPLVYNRDQLKKPLD